MNVFNELWAQIVSRGSKIITDQSVWSQASLEIPKDPLNGDVSTNIAMIAAAKTGANPRELSLKLKEELLTIPYVAHVEVAGPGFINFTIKSEKWHDCIKSILNDDEEFWKVDIGNGEKINIEYVSANPTGPMHIGHARGAVYGDTLANILSSCGYKVTKEYYINDAGSQVDTLLESAYLRYKEAIDGLSIEIPAGLYPGEYLKPIGQKLVDQFKDTLLSMDTKQIKPLIKKIVLEEILKLIKADLADLGVVHEVFFSEESLHEGGKIKHAIKVLTDKKLIYKGALPPPKGKIDENWQEKEQLLFKSTDFGDDQDRPIQKSDGTWSYLAADFAYALDKINRQYDTLIYVLGADHSGYVKRIKGVINALSDGNVKGDVRICQLVNFVKNGQQLKMSKRSGNFMTVRDVVNEVGKDIVRFIMLTRKNDISLDFDFDKVREQSKDNPVFYVQYAYVRTRSIISNAFETVPEAYNKFTNKEFDLSLLNTEEEIQLIKMLASWPKQLASAAKAFEPHRIAYYLLDVASSLHSLWNLGKEDNQYRFNIEDNIELTASRLALAESIRKVIAQGFSLIGVTAMDKM
ncbi:MAG: arginine--tRNA ligase [Rickettsiales bacterium]|nr:arginine--tRNA ligase [Rickettsiales bacterium]